MSLDQVKGGLLFGLGALVSLFVIAQSCFFLTKAVKRAKAIGMAPEKLRRTVTSSIIFAIVPSIAILITVVTLSKALGLALPWFRLSVIGSIAYEIPAASNVAAAYGLSIGSAISDPEAFVSIAWAMTLGSFPPLLMLLLVYKRMQKGLSKIKQRDARWNETLTNAVFLGMIASYIGLALSGSTAEDVETGITTVYGSSVSILTLLTSMLIMALCAVFIKKFKQKWLENFALPFSMVGAMAMSIVYWNVLPEAIRSWQIPGLFGGR
ncbi:MAG: DUF5058 family protein [Oscillospiraceae bacterium]|nr:DUF5058 family protein [Oscillospiraceae bacterium]